MIMRAKQEGDVLILELEGQLDFETTQSLKNTCTELMSKRKAKQLLFNMEKLQFVGSSGISLFISILKHFNRKKGTLKMCNLSSEFAKMFRAYQTTRHPFEIYETELEAIQSYQSPGRRVSRKKRVQESSL